MWKHKKKYKGQLFLGTYEFTRSGKHIFKLKNSNTGRELKAFGSYQEAKKEGFVKV